MMLNSWVKNINHLRVNKIKDITSPNLKHEAKDIPRKVYSYLCLSQKLEEAQLPLRKNISQIIQVIF